MRNQNEQTEQEAKELELRGIILDILKPYMKYDKETNIGCGSAREIQRQMIDLIQQAEQRGLTKNPALTLDNLSLPVIALKAQAKKEGMLRAAEIAKECCGCSTREEILKEANENRP